jgi:hypothetical protein
MSTLATVFVEPGRATAYGLSPEGVLTGTGTGKDVREAVASLSLAPDRIAVATDAGPPTAAAVGIVDFISVQSAVSALLLAGYAVVEVVSVNDGRSFAERVRALVTAEPDLVLLAGGTTGGEVRHLEEFSRVIARARHELETAKGWTPALVFAGNPDAEGIVDRELGTGSYRAVDNVRPACERENLGPAVWLLASLAEFAPIEAATETWPAGAARSAAVAELAARTGEDVLLLHDGPPGAEAVSMLGGRWNRAFVHEGGLPAAVARHRDFARELSGVPLMKDISEAFAEYVRGRDLLDVDPPGLIFGSGTPFAVGAPSDAATRLVDLARPRAVARLFSVDPAAFAALGLAALLGHPLAEETWRGAPEEIAVVVSADGPGGPVDVRLPGETRRVDEGELAVLPVDRETDVEIRPYLGTDLGAGRNRSIRLALPPLPAGLLVDMRGTPVPPPRRVRILPAR